ncbi:MAG: InlB B-repeat-containing protein, partial [Eubacteriales bacterium]
MKKKNRFLSVFMAMVILATMIPASVISSSATYSGTFSFDNTGKFTVMQISDIQDNADVDATVISMITKAITRYSPDLVVLTGDNVTGNLLTSSFQSSVNQFLAPLLNTGTKFAVTFGNHDEEGISPSKSTQYDYYMSHGGSCAVDFDIDALDGVGSGVIPIYSYGQSSGTPAYQLYVMDSGDGASSGYDCCYTNQIDYYIQRSQSYPTVPSLWFMHIPVCDYYTKGMTTVPSGTANSYTGNGTPWSNNSWILTPNKINWLKSGGTSLSEIYKEPSCPANQSTYESSAHRSSAAYGSLTNYQAWANYGNMLGCYVGHDHKNSFVLTTDDGIDLGYCKSATLNSYNDGNPGLRVFELSTDGSYTTKSVTNNDLSYAVGDYTAVNNAITAARYIDNGTTYLRANNINDPNYFNAASTTIGIGIYPASYFVDNAVGLAGAINSVVFGLDTRYQSTIDAYATSVSAAWQAARLKTADYTAVALNMGYTNGTAILAPPFYSATHSGQWLPRAYYTNSTLTAWDAAYNAVNLGLKLPSQTTVDSYASSLATAYAALRLRTDISYTVEYECNGTKIAADKVVLNKTVGTIVTETFQTIPNFEYVADPGDVAGNKSLTLGLTGNVITFNYSGNVNVSYRVEHYQQNVDLNGYTKIQTETIGGTINSTVTATPIIFNGFTYNSSVSGSVLSGIVNGDGSLLLKIYYTRNSYSIVFNANSGTGGTSGAAVFGSALIAPTVARTGYTFTGWSPTVPTTVPANSTTYTAQWQVNNYLITFEADGGSGGSSGSIPFGAKLNAPDVYRKGYTFTGWLPVVPTTVPAINTTYTAQWHRNSYTISFDANDGIGGTSNSMLFGAALVTPEVFREGYDFVCWFPEVPATVPAANTTYVAIWGLKTFTITFDANGGTGGGSMQTLVTGEHLFAPLVLRTGYTFLGWSPEVPPVVPAENATYTAQWSRNYYNIVFDANGGTGGSNTSIGYGDKLAPPEVSKSGYVFAGWTPVVPSEVPAEDMTFYAHWSLQSNLITFDANGGEGGTSGLMAFGADLIAPNIVRTGFTLTGWLPSLPSTVPDVDTTYYAQWHINNYSITFDDNGGEGGNNGSFEYNSALTAPIVSKTGFTFVGWSPEVPSSVPAANTTYTALWVPTIYNITFDANLGTGGTTAQMPFGAALKAPTVTRTGYTFDGWSPIVPISVPVGDSTYTAKWNINSYLITFDANGGTGGNSGTFAFNSTLTAAPVTRTGYTLTGWLPELSSTVPAANTTYVAQWSQDHYTIIFDAGGGTGGSNNSMVLGSTLTAPVVVRTGYTFNGWLPLVPATSPAQNVTYTAQWSVNSYTLKFDANGGMGSTIATVAYGTAINAPIVTRTGYNLTGWSPNVPATMPANSLQLTAIWAANMHDVKFIVDESVILKTSTAFGSIITKPSDPTKAGCLFLGWDPAIPSSMPNQSITFTALWYIISFTVSFNLNGGNGTIPVSQDVAEGSNAILPAQGNITKLGYHFLGWATTKTATVPLNSYLVNNGNVILYAVWSSSQIYIVVKEGSTTVLNQSNSLIYGLKAGITREELESSYLSIIGNGKI